MKVKSRSRAFLIPAAFAACLSLAAGCGGNPNEAENAKTMAPGIPSEHPNDSFAQRRERNMPKPGEPAKGGGKAAKGASK